MRHTSILHSRYFQQFSLHEVIIFSIKCPKLSKMMTIGDKLRKHCQRHNRPKTLNTLTHSTHLLQIRIFNKQQLQLGFVWQRAKIHRTTLTNKRKNLNKFMQQLREIPVSFLTNTAGEYKDYLVWLLANWSPTPHPFLCLFISCGLSTFKSFL